MPRPKKTTVATGTVLPVATSVPDKRKARHTCWVINNWTTADLERVRRYAESECRYMCWSQEVAPETGTPHLQGYTAWDNPRSLAKFKDTITPPVPDAPKLHYEPYTKGSALQNRNYCLGQCEKKGFTANPSFEEVGELPQQGERTDWRDAVTALRAGQNIPTVIDAQPQLLPSVRALERYQQMSLRPLNRTVKVILLIGAPGTGKSRWAYENYPDLYSKPEGQWFDGYSGQSTLLLDDFYGDIPYSLLLKVLDRYPLQVPVKGGFVHAQWTTVLITSNKHYNLWYSKPEGHPQQDLRALERRISETKEFI